jgi:hypothetical protein
MTNLFAYLFILGLFGNAFNSLNYIVSNDQMISEQLEKTWKEVIMA